MQSLSVKRYLFGVIPLVVIVAAGVFGYPKLLRYQDDRDFKKAETAATDQTKKNHLDQAEASWSKYEKTARSGEHRYHADLELGNLSMTRKKYADAEKWYKKCENYLGYDKDLVESGIALAAEANDDKPVAIEYLKRLRDRTNPNDPLAGRYKQDFDERIKALGGQP